MKERITQQLKDGPQEINLMKWFSRAAMENIGRGGFGYSFGPLDSPEATAFSDNISRLGYVIDVTILSVICHLTKHNRFLFLQTVLLRVLLLPYVIDLGTPSLRRTVLNYLPSSNCKEIVSVVDSLALKSTSGDDVDEGKDILSTLCKSESPVS